MGLSNRISNSEQGIWQLGKEWQGTVDELEMSAVGLILFPSPLSPQILLMIFRNFRYWVSYNPNLFRLPQGKLSTVTAQINKSFHSSSQ